MAVFCAISNIPWPHSLRLLNSKQENLFCSNTDFFVQTLHNLLAYNREMFFIIYFESMAILRLFRPASLPIFIFIFHSARPIGTISVREIEIESISIWHRIAPWKFHRAIFHQLFDDYAGEGCDHDTRRVFSVCSLNNFIHYFFSSMKVSKIIFAVVPESCFRCPSNSTIGERRKRWLGRFAALICVCFAKVGNRTGKNLGYY